MKTRYALIFVAVVAAIVVAFSATENLGKYSYDDFETPEYCGKSCHTDFYSQWKNSMMAQAYTHEWDEIEYFELAVEHADKEPKLSGIKADCDGCHTPLAYMAGDNPPPRPSEGSRANESVSCEVCHNITGIDGDTSYNFNYIVDPGRTKYNSRPARKNSPDHEIEVNPVMSEARFCGICHNEKSPFGAWVKSTQLEWQDGPYSKEGVPCQDCHMPRAPMRTASMGEFFEDARTHLFHGAHAESKVRGAIDVRVYANRDEVPLGEPVKITVAVFNQKAGHKIPSGSVEDRILWLHVEAVDSEGNVFHLPVDKKGFEGEEYTIASDKLAYRDMGIPLGKPNFEGLRREDVPLGDRIFRMAYFTPDGEMTIQQWNTASFGVDYRVGPRETKIETYTFEIPYDIAPGKIKINAELNYRLLVKPVGEFLNVPESEWTAFQMNKTSTEIEVF